MDKPKNTKSMTWEEANRFVDFVQGYVRCELAQYSTEALMNMLSDGKNPLLGDKP